MNAEDIDALNRRSDGMPTPDVIRLALGSMNGGAVFTTSFGAEDQAITHMLAEHQFPVDVITLDTGRLFNETLETFDRTALRYGLSIKIMFPESAEVEAYVNAHGPNAFYESVELRKNCCNIRKVKPLARGLQGYRLWITGLRADQSDHRSGLKYFEWDDRFRIVKVNPLLTWSYDEVVNFLKANNVPYNPLHDLGFVSIGCAPCTRAIEPGEDFRAGRWWWESSKKECGLHR